MREHVTESRHSAVVPPDDLPDPAYAQSGDQFAGFERTGPNLGGKSS